MEKNNLKEAYHNSRLGQILIKNGYISQEQLDEAIFLSSRKNEKLGEYLIKHRMLLRWQLRRALSRQSQLRLSASLLMTLLSPVYKLFSPVTAKQVDPSLKNLLNPIIVAAADATFEFDHNLSTIEIKHNSMIGLKVPSSLGELNFDGIRLIDHANKNYHNLSVTDLDLTDARLHIGKS